MVEQESGEGREQCEAEQAAGIEQINIGVTELDKVTQLNAANAEELAAASEETAAQVKILNEMIGRYTSKAEISDDEGEVAQFRIAA